LHEYIRNNHDFALTKGREQQAELSKHEQWLARIKMWQDFDADANFKKIDDISSRLELGFARIH